MQKLELSWERLIAAVPVNPRATTPTTTRTARGALLTPFAKEPIGATAQSAVTMISGGHLLRPRPLQLLSLSLQLLR